MPKADDRQTLQHAVFLHQAGQLEKAAAIYRRILQGDPDNITALHYLGIVEAAVGNFAQAKSLMARSLRTQPVNIQFVENFATVLAQSGDYGAALEFSQRSLQSNPTNASLLYVSATALLKLKRLEDALAQFDKLVAVQPNHLAGINERGSVLAEMKRYDAALASFQRALSLQPQYAEAHLNVGNLYGTLKRYDDAVAAFDKALTLKPDSADARFGRASALTELDRKDEAVTEFEKALAIRPDHAEARVGACVGELHILYSSEAEVVSCREAYQRKLRALYDDVEAGRVPGNLAKAIEFKQPFFLAYQGRNDRDLQRLYGTVVCGTMQREYPDAPLTAPALPGEPVRVGIVSSFFAITRTGKFPSRAGSANWTAAGSRSLATTSETSATAKRRRPPACAIAFATTN